MIDGNTILQLGVGGAFAIFILMAVFWFILKWRNGNQKKSNTNSVHQHDTKEIKSIVVGIKDKQNIHDSRIEVCMENLGKKQDELVKEQKQTNQYLNEMPNKLAEEISKVL